MNILKYIIINIIGTLFRAVPIPCKTGLVKIGNPDKNSPVFLTCNYLLTVERVKRALKNIDCYLLIANSRGINVWCASTGGYLTNHDVISVLKTSGIEKLVNHRNIILPQLAATGIEARIIKEKTGWNVIWGPVYAKDIPRFIQSRYRKTPNMRKVRFDPLQRLEIAVMWAFPFSVITGFITMLIWPSITIPLMIIIWVLSLLAFMPFPLYSKFISLKDKTLNISKYTVFFDLSSNTLLLWGIFMVILVFYELAIKNLSCETIFKWGLISFILTLFLNMDLMGSTPIYKSSLHEEKRFKISIDVKKCSGCGICIQVCPRNCYEINKKLRKVEMVRVYKCVKCGACIVQCPENALYFRDPDGNIIPPEIIRKFKLNLLGKRLVKT